VTGFHVASVHSIPDRSDIVPSLVIQTYARLWWCPVSLMLAADERFVRATRPEALNCSQQAGLGGGDPARS